MSVYLECPETYRHTLKLNHLVMPLALNGQSLLGENCGYIWGKGNFEPIMLLWLLIFIWQHIFKLFFIKYYLLQFMAKLWALLEILKIWGSYQRLDSLKMKANLRTIRLYFSLNITLRSLHCNFKCLNMLCLLIMIQIIQIQLFNTSQLWDIQWKPYTDIFPRRPPCIYAIWLTKMKSYNNCTAITHFQTPGTYT